MTKRKRTPPLSPSHSVRVVQIPASLQRLSILSRSLAFQSENLSGGGQDAQNGHDTRHRQTVDDTTLTGTASVNMNSPNGQIQGFKAFAPSKQLSFPNTQLCVAPKPRAIPTPDTAAFMPPTQPCFHQGQAWPQPQPRRVVSPPPKLAPALIAPQTTPIRFDPAPTYAAPLCLETQPHLVAALIAQKRAANEANRKREAWSREASQHRRSERPEDQLLSELNQTLEPSYIRGTPTLGEISTTERPSNGALPVRRFVTSTPAITFDPTVPRAARPDTNSSMTSQSVSRQTSEFITTGTGLNSARDSSFSYVDSTLDPTKSRTHKTPHQPHQDPLHGQPSAPAITAPIPVPIRISNAPSAAASSAHQQQHRKQITKVAGGYHKFDPRHWQTISKNQQQQGYHRVDPDQLAVGTMQSTLEDRATNNTFRN